jgi:hypothetical protein
MPANPIDLTLVANVQTWLGNQNAFTGAEAQTVQDCITAFSLYALQLCGRGNADGSVPTTSPFVIPTVYDEFYDGNGNNELPLRNWPITAVAAVTDGGAKIQASASTTSPGYVVDQSKKFLVLRYGGSLYSQRGRYGSYCGRGWSLGTQNIEVQYTAGFSGVPFDLEMVARKVVALNYKRRQSIGQKSEAMAAGAGTVTFGDWEMDKQDQKVLDYYKSRVA